MAYLISEQGITEDAILNPLTFSEQPPPRIAANFEPFANSRVRCPLCEWNNIVTYDEHQSINLHMIAEHQLVVDDLEKIGSYEVYFNYWRQRFNQETIEKICPKIPKDETMYYLLSPAINPEDGIIRSQLTAARLDWLLAQQKTEREDNNFRRMCLFCKHTETGTRANYITHLRFQHNLIVGRPDNLVFVDKLLDILESHMESLKCLYCNLIFKDRITLKEHMRKKFHKRINPENKLFDRFFMSSYIDGGDEDDDETALDAQNGVNSWSQWREEGTDWSDWQEEQQQIVCLFCNFRSVSWEQTVQHLMQSHQFNYEELRLNRNYYEQVKIVNFIRRERHLLRCYVCQERFSDGSAWTDHVQNLQHSKIPDRPAWDHPEFFFPTFENDSLLSCLEENEEDPVDSLSSQLQNAASVHKTD